MQYSGIKSIAKNAMYLSLAKVITSVARGIYAVLLAKYLGAELYGLFNYGLSWYVLFVPLSVLGLDTILVREIGRNRDQAQQLIGQTMALRSVASLFVSLLCFVVGWLFEPEYSNKLVLLLFSFALLGRGMSLWTSALFRAHEDSGYIFWLEAVFRIFEVTIGLALLTSGYGLVEVVIAHSSSWLLQGAVGFVVIRRRLSGLRMIWSVGAQMQLIRKGAPFVLATFLLGWLLQGPILMFRHFVGDAQALGQLALALQALFILGAIVAELGVAALPVLSRSVARNDGKSSYYLDVVLRVGIIMGGVLTIAALSIGEWLILSLFGPSFPLTVQLLPWTLALVTPYFWMQSFMSALTAHGYFKMVALTILVGAVVFTISFPLLAKSHAAMGVVYALGVGMSVVVAGQLGVLQKGRFAETLNSLGPAAVAAGIAISICWWLAPINILLALSASLIILILAVILFGVVRASEIQVVRSIVFKIAR